MGKYIHLIYIALVCFISEVWLSGLKRHPAKVLAPIMGSESSNLSASAKKFVIFIFVTIFAKRRKTS